MSTSSFTYVYMIVSYDDWQEFKRSEKQFKDDELDREDVIAWYREQVSKRLNGLEVEFPYYCFVDKPDYKKYTTPPKRVILKIRIDKSLVVYFDDNFYVLVLNDLYNKRYEYLAYTKEEQDEKEGCTREQCLQSFERMFDLDPTKRCRNWSGDIILRAYIPHIKRSMIRKVWIYNWNRRLRRNKI